MTTHGKIRMVGVSAEQAGRGAEAIDAHDLQPGRLDQAVKTSCVQMLRIVQGSWGGIAISMRPRPDDRGERRGRLA